MNFRSPDYLKIWLGYEDSNLGMHGSKPCALTSLAIPQLIVSNLFLRMNCNYALDRSVANRSNNGDLFIPFTT